MELMVALFLGGILMLGVLQIFSANKRSNTMQQEFARVQEGGRMSMEMLARDIRMADYWGCLRDASIIACTDVASSTSNDITTNPGKICDHLDHTDIDYASKVVDWGGAAVFGNDNVASLTINSKTVIAGTDVLTLKTSSDYCDGKGRIAQSSTAASLHLSPACDVQEGEVVMLSNCKAGEMFTTTNVSPGNATTKLTLTHNTGSLGGGRVDNQSKNFQQLYGAESKLLRPVRRIYFLSLGASGVPSLFRQENNNAAVELVSGVENLQFSYGVDSDGNGSVDNYLSAGVTGLTTTAHWDLVRTIKVTLTVRAEENTSSDADGRLRKDYISVVDIRNRSLN